MDGPQDIARVARPATRGARAATGSNQDVADAVAATIERWEDATIRRKLLRNPEGWAFRVAANFIRSGCRKQVQPTGGGSTFDRVDANERGVDDRPESSRSLDDQRQLVAAFLARHQRLLRGRQWEVILKMTDPSMSLARAAKELGMDRANLRRTFRSALARIARIRGQAEAN
jgi:DNA-directed RNA polymerase specialized sigma24 family protein